MGDLEHARQKALASPLKLARDVRSYAVEAALLGSSACTQLSNALGPSGVHVARAYASELLPCEDELIESKFSMLLHDFSPSDGWRQSGMLSSDEAASALRALARFHAFFWDGANVWRDADVARELEAALWPAGGYWQPSMQPEKQWTELARSYSEHYTSFGPDFFADVPELANVDMANLGGRLEKIAKRAAADAHPFDLKSGGDAEANRRFRTVVHGDPKAANLFLRDASSGDEQPNGACEVGLIDFQWSGFGLAATDTAHHICAALAPECLSADGALETELLDGYYSTLIAALIEYGAADSADAAQAMFTRSELQEQYETAVLDMGRLVFAYQWSRADFTTEPLNRNSYNKSIKVARWLVARCDALLKQRSL